MKQLFFVILHFGCFAIALSNAALSADRMGTAKSYSAIPPRSASVNPSPANATELAQMIVGEDVAVSNAVLIGAAAAAGSFTNGQASIGIASGIVLSSGDVADVVGPNSSSSTSTSYGLPGDTDLDPLTGGYQTLDAVVIEFDFVPTTSSMQFQYVFASEEYNEFVNSSFYDVLGFFVNGVNCALVDMEPVSANTINNGNPYGTPPNSNPQLFVNNESGSLETEMDGLTLPLTCSASVVKDQPNHVKIAIADTADSILDSAVFVQAMNINPSEVPELSVKDGYIRLDTTNGSLPPSIDCSSPSQHAGRMVVDEENAVLYICIGTGWNAVPF